MKFSTPKFTIPSVTIRLEIVLLAILVYLIGACFLFGSCLKVTFTEGMSELQESEEHKVNEGELVSNGMEHSVEEFGPY